MDSSIDELGKSMDVSASLDMSGKDRQYHTVQVSGNAFTVDVRYHSLKPVGAGSYGLVVSAEDTVTGEMVAIKKIADTFRDLVDAKRIMREIMLLRKLGDHENIISLVDIMVQVRAWATFGRGARSVGAVA